MDPTPSILPESAPKITYVSRENIPAIIDLIIKDIRKVQDFKVKGQPVYWLKLSHPVSKRDIPYVTKKVNKRTKAKINWLNNQEVEIYLDP